MPRFFLLVLITISQLSMAQVLSPRCSFPSTGEEPVFLPIQIFQNHEELSHHAETQYKSEARLRGRAFQNRESGNYFFSYPENIQISKSFISALTQNIEIALERSYADFITYADMGHVHLLVSEKDWGTIKKYSSSERTEKLLNLPKLKLLYHTAEFLKLREGSTGTGPFPQDQWKLWRYFSRNLLGENANGRNLAVIYSQSPGYNTVRSIEGYQERLRIYFSSSHAGCFPLRAKGRTMYFDFTLQNLPTPNSNL